MNTIAKNMICSATILTAMGILAGPGQWARAADKHKHDHAGEHAGEHAESEKEHDDSVTLTPEAIKANGITIQQAKKQQLVNQMMVPARIAFNGDMMAHVGSPVRGRVVEIKVKLGQKIRQGDELAVIESPELGEAQSEFIQKRAEFAVAQSAVEPARQSYERGKALFDENQGIALAEVQKRLADMRAAEGAVQTATAAAASAENRLHLFGMNNHAIETLLTTREIQPRYVVRAPITGQIIQRELTQGELVNPDREALMVIADLSTVWVWADVPEARIGQIEEGAAVAIRAVGLQETITGKTSFISPMLDSNTRTVRVRVDVDNSNGKLRPGMFAQAEIAEAADPQTAEVIAVPEDAVHTVEGSPAVFVPTETGGRTFAKRTITIGSTIGGLVPILSGLREGEPYVAAGSFILKADMGKAGAAHEH